MSRHLTINIISTIPYSNLNRDDSGTPKRVKQGGVLRGLHSSQSIKRGIRARYEEASGDISVRSGLLTEEVIRGALQLNSALDEKSVTKMAKDLIGKLTKKEASEGESARSIWLSQEELDTASQYIVDALSSNEEEAGPSGDFINQGKTGSMAITAFGRMFANAPQFNIEAALSVSPAVSTHAISIDTDYFSTGDDLREAQQETGATFLGIAQFTNGVFYRSVTIDKVQLKETWTAFGNPDSKANLEALVRSVVYGQPRGKENSTAPYTLPALVLAEEQRYRVAYDFERPVLAQGAGGFLESTVQELASQRKLSREFDPENFGPVESLAGTYGNLAEEFEGLEVSSLQGLIDDVVEWILDD